ncbi:MAG: ABC transporter ATP-binding protein, partial [Desulfobacteraceae bacterium]|nr:ABC transporter ATP-binding protein [Desulfobacteraceae bacterium]
FYSGLISPISELLGLIGLTIIIFLGSQKIHSGTFTTGTFFVFIMSFVNIYRPLKEISNGMINYQMALDAGRRLIILHKKATKEKKKTGTVKIEQFHKLQIENLWFSYSEKIKSDNEFVLRDLNLTIQKGETVALVGATGAGKSTLCDLIFRLYEFQKGIISLNDVPLKQVDSRSLKNIFSLCSQETIVFNNSLLEDIRIARPSATREEVMAVAEAVGLSSFMNSLDRGIDTWIGDRGGHCSGGQRQMIALARAIIQKPELLVLDEAISGIDVKTGEKIWQNIQKLLPGCTIL